MLLGVNKILAVTTDAQKIAVIEQIDSGNKRLRTFKQELDKLLSPVQRKHTLNSSEVDMDTEVMDLKRDLEAQLEDEIKKRNAINKIAATDPKQKSSHSGGDRKDIEVQVLISERLISKTKEHLDILNSVCALFNIDRPKSKRSKCF
jgi:hypothetical protein